MEFTVTVEIVNLADFWLEYGDGSDLPANPFEIDDAVIEDAIHDCLCDGIDTVKSYLSYTVQHT